MAGTGAIAASLIIVVTITPQQIIPMIFGDSWANLHSFLIPMTWWIGFHFFGSSLSTIYIKLRKLGYIFAFNIFNALFTFLSIYISAKLDKDAIFATTIFSVGRAFLYGTLALGGLKMIQSYKSKQLAI
jgi:O-antigen/teichoic acid export membrane protein